MALYRDQGVVLRTIRLGEADRIVTFVTEGHGKVRAVAKGVRKTKSRFGGRLEPTSHVSLLMYEGRELDIVTQAEALDHFRVIREDLDRLARATTMLEAVDQVAQERQPGSRLYQMLVGGLRALAAHNAPLLVPGFFLDSTNWRMPKLPSRSMRQVSSIQNSFSSQTSPGLTSRVSFTSSPLRCRAARITGWRKRPVERRAQIVTTPPVIGQPFCCWPRFPFGFGPLEEVSVKFGVATRDRVQLAALGKLFERVGPRRVEQPVSLDAAVGFRQNQ